MSKACHSYQSMRLVLSEEDRAEIERFSLRSACMHCSFYVARHTRCAHDWPNEEQARTPLSAYDDIALCKEFELR